MKDKTSAAKKTSETIAITLMAMVTFRIRIITSTSIKTVTTTILVTKVSKEIKMLTIAQTAQIKSNPFQLKASMGTALLVLITTPISTKAIQQTMGFRNKTITTITTTVTLIAKTSFIKNETYLL